MLQNAHLLAKIGADTAENERNFAKHLPKIGSYATGPPPYGPRSNPALALDHRAPGDEDAQQVPERVLRRGDARVGVVALLHLMRLGVRISKIGKMILQIFGGLVLGCIKSKFCKKICV